MLQKPTVVHCKKSKYEVYIGRPSKWGNPFEIGKDGTREEVVEKYRKWVVEQKDLLADLHELAGVTIACWCSPLPCHGDVLAELVQEFIKKEVREYKEGDDLTNRLMCYRCRHSFPAPRNILKATPVKCLNCGSVDARHEHKCAPNDPLRHTAGWPYDDPTVKCDC